MKRKTDPRDGKAQDLALLLEEQRRRTVRNSLVEWCRQCGFEPAAHHKLIIAKLEQMVRPPRGEGERGARDSGIGGDPTAQNTTKIPNYTTQASYIATPFHGNTTSIPEITGSNTTHPRTHTHLGTTSIDRLAIFMPPGSAKSTYASILFPPWAFAQKPDMAVIVASHTQELAERWGRKVRNLISEHGSTLGVGLSSDSQAAGRWETDKGGEYFAAGVGGAITGRRADLVVIDDPVRSREDADSELIRDKTWDWYRSDLYTRLKPGGKIVLIQTRWHEDDLAGRVLADMASGGDQWDIISLPAVAEEQDALGRNPGECLWPDWENLEELDRKRRAVGPRGWSALYQQRPAPEEGDYFKAAWFKPYDTHPDPQTMRVYGGSDYAVTADGGDYTVHIVVGLDSIGRMYLLDLWRKQASSSEWVEAFCDLVKKWKPIGWAEEKGQISAGIGPYLDRRQRERAAYCARESFPTRGDKAVRAQSIRGRMDLDGLYVPTHARWFPDFRSELLSFPAGKYDDQVDALGLVGQLLDHMVSGQEILLPPIKVKTGYKPLRASEHQPGDWLTY